MLNMVFKFFLTERTALFSLLISHVPIMIRKHHFKNAGNTKLNFTNITFFNYFFIIGSF